GKKGGFDEAAGKQLPLPGKQFLTGTFCAHGKGFGFVMIPDREEDIFVPAEMTMGAMQGDTVQVRLLKGHDGPRTRGEVVRILERAVRVVVGTYFKNKNFGFIVPDNAKQNRDFFVDRAMAGGAMSGDKVRAEILRYGTDFENPTARITEVLGREDDPGVDMLSVLMEADIPLDFPEKVLNMAARIPDAPIPADFEGRLDLRDMMMVTIDGPDAKDLDDAVSLEKVGDEYHLGVHIADVANYVQAGSAMDREALKRGTSVYVPDRVVPMLPEKLSNGICSLNAGEERLALSCLMTLNHLGRVIDYKLAETVICVDRRMSYPDVKAILEDQDPVLTERDAAFVPMLRDMLELSKLIRARRWKRGAIDFNFPEPEFVLDENGAVLDIRAHEANCATELIEDFMLTANETVAKHFRKMKSPFVYRIHEKPDEDKVRRVLEYINREGIPAEVPADGNFSAKFCQQILRKVRKAPFERLVAQELLRSMAKARYSEEPAGHFGLAAKDYCHFTSPIRRYPDLQIHRIIKDELRGRLTPDKMEQYADFLPDVCEQTSMTEKRAADLERKCDKVKAAQFMKAHVGDTFEGHISGVTGWGFYVELPNTVEGLVPMSLLIDDYYDLNEDEHAIMGRLSGKMYRLGDVVRVRCKDVDTHLSTIDFEVADEYDKKNDTAGKRRRVADKN
ncbi:MAG: ribonuclease R, partial [Lachnospiraceae bacterium]|nr:ribonuclease R [Lachnospiraceae bacterium]